MSQIWFERILRWRKKAQRFLQGSIVVSKHSSSDAMPTADEIKALIAQAE